jgi:hypothetical protein
MIPHIARDLLCIWRRVMRHCWVSPLTSGRILSRRSLPGFYPIRHDYEQPRRHPPNVSILPLPRRLVTEGWRLKRSHHASRCWERVYGSQFTIQEVFRSPFAVLRRKTENGQRRTSSTTAAMDFATAAASDSVGASTITRMRGSVPEGRTRMRPVDPSSFSWCSIS